METKKRSRAAGMAATYADILVRAKAYEPPQRENSQLHELAQQIAKGETNWWQVCLGQIPATRE